MENETLCVEIDSFGAELKSVKNKDTQQEYMWQGDSNYWGRTSPILFPFVGNLKNRCYRYDGKSYNMGSHGFARDMEHTMLSKTDTAIYFELVNTEETLQKYPFTFVLNVGYELAGNELRVVWQVTNTATDKALHFSIGAHPGFNCPIYGEENKAGYKLYFAGMDEIHYHGHTSTGLSVKEDFILPLKNHRAIITPEFFDRGTYIIEDCQTKEIGLEDPNGNRIVSMFFDMPVLALWSPEGKNAPFLCIEPWCGICDSVDFEGTLEERAFNNCLKAGKQFSTSYIMRFGA